MKLIYLLFTFFLTGISTSLFSQSESQIQEIRDLMWKNTDPEFSQTTINPEYADESAVVICRKLEYEVKKEIFFTYLYENKYLHQRVKLQDKSAVEEFSELEFDFTNNFVPTGLFVTEWENYVGIRVIKPDGTEREVSLEEAVDESVSQGFQKYQLKKFAIPDLEPGDIIDYYFVTKHTTLNPYMEVFDPWLYRLSGKYPIQKHYVELRTYRQCFLNVTALNGAPRFRKSSPKGDQTIYKLAMNNIGKEEIKRWQYPYREYPTLKFQAFYFSGKGKTQSPILYKFVDAKKQVREQFTNTEIRDFLYYLAYKWGSSNSILDFNLLDFLLSPPSDFDKIKTYMRANFHKETDPEIIARETMYYLRQLTFREDFVKNDLLEEQTDDNRELVGEPPYAGNYETISIISRILKHKKIPYELFLTTSNEYGTLDDYLIPPDLSLGIVVKNKKGREIYISSMNRFSTFGELPPSVQGAEAIAIDPYKSRSERTFRKLTLPAPNADYTSHRTDSYITFDTENMDSLYITRNISISGYGRYYYQNNYLLPKEYLDAGKDDKFRFDKLDDEDLLKRAEDKYEQDRQDRLARYKKTVLSEYSIDEVSIKDFNYLESGMWEESPAFCYRDSFAVNDFLSRVGPNYLLEIGKLIGEQVTLSEKELEPRTVGIYMNTARKYQENLEVIIPEGFEPEGIEELNVNISNETGSFKASAVYEGGILKIRTTKTYNRASFPAEKWDLMKEFLNGAYTFTQKKVLLQRI